MRYWRHVPGIGEGYDGDALWAVEMWEGEKSELRTSQIYMISISHLSGGGGNARMATCALSRQYSSVTVTSLRSLLLSTLAPRQRHACIVLPLHLAYIAKPPTKLLYIEMCDSSRTSKLNPRDQCQHIGFQLASFQSSVYHGVCGPDLNGCNHSRCS